MPNTVNGPYTKTTWIDGSTMGNQTRLNNLETQASVALNGFNGDLLTPFVLSGITCSKDGTIANQLDVTSGRAYLKMSDNTVGLIATVASTASQFLTTTPSTTYYLFLKNDGTWQWSTTSTGPTNSLAIAHATTDGSGNINVVTDDRITSTSLLPGAGGLLVGNGDVAIKSQRALNGLTLLPQYHPAGTAYGILFQTWDGATANNTLSVGSNVAGAYTYFGARGNLAQINLQATVGSFGVPPIVAQLIDQAVTDTLFHSFTLATVPATGLYRVTAQFYLDAGTARLITLSVSFTQGHSGSATSQAFISNSAAGHGKLWDGSGTGDSAAAGDAPGSRFELYLSGGTSISVRFQDPGWTSGTDRVNAILERLT